MDRRIGLLACVMGCGFTTLLIAEGQGRITGTVTSFGRSLAVGSTVVLTPASPGLPPLSATTNQDGKYVISSVPAGNYELHVDEPAYHTKLKLEDNETLTINLSPITPTRKAPESASAKKEWLELPVDATQVRGMAGTKIQATFFGAVLLQVHGLTQGGRSAPGKQLTIILTLIPRRFGDTGKAKANQTSVYLQGDINAPNLQPCPNENPRAEEPYELDVSGRTWERCVVASDQQTTITGTLAASEVKTGPFESVAMIPIPVLPEEAKTHADPSILQKIPPVLYSSTATALYGFLGGLIIRWVRERLTSVRRNGEKHRSQPQRRRG